MRSKQTQDRQTTLNCLVEKWAEGRGSGWPGKQVEDKWRVKGGKGEGSNIIMTKMAYQVQR